MNAFDKSVKNASLTYFSNFDNKTGTFVFEIFWKPYWLFKK